MRARRVITITRKARTISGRANELRTIAKTRALAAEQGKRVRVVNPKEASR